MKNVTFSDAEFYEEYNGINFATSSGSFRMLPYKRLRHEYHELKQLMYNEDDSRKRGRPLKTLLERVHEAKIFQLINFVKNLSVSRCEIVIGF